MKKIDRRQFLITSGAAAGTAFLINPLSANHPQQAPHITNPMSRVVVVTDEDCTTGSTINTNVLQVMMDDGIKCCTGLSEIGEAWKSLFPGINSDSVIGIKVNCANPSVPSHPLTVQAVINGLLQMDIAGGYDENNIIIWERTNWELQNSGFTLNTGSTGVRCFGTNQSGVGFDYANPINVNGSTQYPSKILTQYCDYIVNLSVIKDHGVAGATLGLKNHYGSVHAAIYLHGGYCDPYLPALNQQIRDELGDKEKIRIIDSIFGVSSGGPGGSIDFVYNGVIISKDIVAADRVGLDILVENGMNHAWQATHIETASEPPYYLGNYELSQIERIDIENPSVYEPQNVTIEIEPVSPPINIPAGGGEFQFNLVITNNETFAVSLDAWTMVQLPDGTMYGPAILRNMNIPAGGAVLRTMTQNVPAGAPSGDYIYFGRTGENPVHVWNESSFTFNKES